MPKVLILIEGDALVGGEWPVPKLQYRSILKGEKILEEDAKGRGNKSRLKTATTSKMSFV